MRLGFAGAALAASLLAACAGNARAQASPNQIEQISYFRADIRDRAGCFPRVEDGAVSWPDGVGDPAINCPDAYAWASLVQALQQKFWTWGTDQTIWIDNPKPICLPNQKSEDCCDPAVMGEALPIEGAPPAGCPYFPTDWTDPPALTVAKPRSSHSHDFLQTLDPARVLRQEEAEIVFRNRPFVRYSFVENLYNKESLGARFTAMQNWIADHAPFNNPWLTVAYPSDAVMFKVDFLSQSEMLEAGLIRQTAEDGSRLDPPNDPDHPYVTMRVDETIAPGDEEPELYYLVSVTAASKALPNWHWYAYEHVGNLGRCDYTGCNDSFGYRARGIDVGGANFGGNYIPPKTENSGDASNDIVFKTGLAYTVEETGEEITPALRHLFASGGIATGDGPVDPDTPSAADPAWLSYRLKASQTSFVTDTGMATHAGQSITEGGFVNSASCMTCHSQAGPDADGNPGVPGIGSRTDLNLFGLNETVNGAPDPDWFYAEGTTTMRSLPFDFVWGMLNASCVEPDGETGRCKSYDDPQFAPPVARIEEGSTTRRPAAAVRGRSGKPVR